MKKISHLIVLLILHYTASAQDAETFSIGILPTTSTIAYGNSYREHIRESLTKVFAEKSRFTVVDRSKLDAISQERDLQKEVEFFDGKVAEQGKAIGAQYLASANIYNLSANSIQITKSRSVKGADGKYYTQNYNVPGLAIIVGINIQLVDVATGGVKSTRQISKSLNYESTEPNACILSTLSQLEPQMRAWINDVFPVEMKIVSIETTNKKGLPETVLVKGGNDMNLQHSRALFGLVNSSTQLEVVEVQIIKLDGKEINRPIVVGKVVVHKVEGELSVCKVKDGAETIQQKLNAGVTLYIRIKSY